MKISIEIQKAKGGGYIIWRDGELAFAASTLPELYEELGHSLRTTYNEGVHLPHATVHRIDKTEVDAQPVPRKPEAQARPASYTVPNLRPRDTADLMREQTAHLNGATVGIADRVPAVG